MSSKEEILRSPIVKLNQKNHELFKLCCVKHLSNEGIAKRTIFAILICGSIERKSGSDRKTAIMTNKVNKN